MTEIEELILLRDVYHGIRQQVDILKRDGLDETALDHCCTMMNQVFSSMIERKGGTNEVQAPKKPLNWGEINYAIVSPREIRR